MTVKKHICILLLMFALWQAQAQQVGMYNHYFFKPMVYNPAFAGSGQNIEAMLVSRAQWTGFNGAPQLNIFTLDGAIKEKRVGLGLTLVNERRGINLRNGGNLAYSYRLRVNDEAYLLLGLSVGIVNHALDFSKAVAENYADPTLFSGIQQKTTFDGNAGLAFIWKGLQLGVSAPQLFANRLNYVDDSSTRTYYVQVRHYIASAKYKFILSEDKGISLAPQFVTRIVPNAPLQFDGILNLDWENKFWLGAIYKSNYALGINAGIYIHKKLCIGYAYEIITADLGKYAGISHEIMVNFRFGGKKKEISEDSLKIAEERRIAKEAAYTARVDSLQEVLEQNRDRIKELNKKLSEQAKLQEQTQAQVQALQKDMQDKTFQSGDQNPGQAVTTTQTPSNTSSNNGQSSVQSANSNPKQNVITNVKTTSSSKGNAVNNNDEGVVIGKKNSALDMMDSKVLEDNVWIASYPASGYKNEQDQNPSPGYYIIVGTFFYRDFAIAETERFRKKGYKVCNWIYSENTKHNYIFTHRLSSREESILKVKEIQGTGVQDAWILQLK